MTIEETKINETWKVEKKYSESVIKEVDEIISKTYDIINSKETLELNPSKKIEELISLRKKVTKTIIRLWGNDIDDMPNDFPWAWLAIIMVTIYDFLKGLTNEDLPKLKYRLDNIDKLMKILEEKKD